MSVLSPFEPGHVIAKKYRVDRVLGSGGMGYVLAAVHVSLGQRVAIKLLLPQIVSSPEAVARFLREARRAVQIQSEHVARVLDIGELDDGAPYIVMEYLDGRDLDAVLRERTTLPAMEVVGYVLQACEALSEAHALGIVHRDLKPANLFLARRPDGTFWVKLLDFGISKGAAEGDARLTQSAAFLGSPLYSAPEQLMSSRDADARADIWSLGVILYEALAGVTPFGGESVSEVIVRIYQMTPRPLHELRPDLPLDLCHVVMRCLDKSRDGRFANVSEFALALRPFAQDGSSVERIARVMARNSSVPDIASRVSSVEVAPRVLTADRSLSSTLNDPTLMSESGNPWVAPRASTALPTRPASPTPGAWSQQQPGGPQAIPTAGPWSQQQPPGPPGIATAGPSVEQPPPRPPGISTAGAWGEQQPSSPPSPRRSASRAVALALIGATMLLGGATLVVLAFRHGGSSDVTPPVVAAQPSTGVSLGTSAPPTPIVALTPIESVAPEPPAAPGTPHPPPAVLPPKPYVPVAVAPKLSPPATVSATPVVTTPPAVTAPKKHDPQAADVK